MYTLKSIAQRGTAFGAALAVLAATVVPATPAFADALNPLTDRSLTLSSSSPGWSNTDGSGNSTYAPPNSGANGQKTGNYFSFKPSTSATVNTFSFQYCTTSAGSCEIPGNNVTRGTDTATTSDLDVNLTGATEVSGTDVAIAGTIDLASGSTAVTGTGTNFLVDLKVNQVIKTAAGHSYVIASIANATSLTLKSNAIAAETGATFTKSGFAQVINTATGDVRAVPGYTNNNPKYISQGGVGDPAEAAKGVTGSYIVMYKNGAVWTQSTGWAVASHSVTTGTGVTENYITLTSASGQAFTSGQEVKVLFFANGTHFITNPGAGAFFVKINTYNKEFSLAPTGGQVGLSGLAPASDANIIDGGVTVANVMNQSIQITTKVLETMQFSVGTVDPTTLTKAQLAASDKAQNSHTSCDTILTRMTPADPQNVLALGNQAAESSLETDNTYATHSYWRLSSNSSAGATVYYSGHTLSNTVGDEIDPIGTTASPSLEGSEQFGLAIATTPLSGGNGWDDALYGVNYDTTSNATTFENGADKAALTNLVGSLKNVDNSVLSDLGATNIPAAPDYTALNASFHLPRLDPLVPLTDYANGSGTIDGTGTQAQFAFDPMSDTVPAPIASQDTQVVDCVTAKMRYIANIAATTPAGIYTTKINYIAAPQY